MQGCKGARVHAPPQRVIQRPQQKVGEISNSHYGNGQSLHALTVVATSQTRSRNEPQYRFSCLVGARNGRDNFRSIRSATIMRVAVVRYAGWTRAGIMEYIQSMSTASATKNASAEGAASWRVTMKTSSNSHYGNGQSLHALTVVETSQTRSGNEPQYRFLCLVGARNGRDNFRSIRSATIMRIAGFSRCLLFSL